MRDSRLPAPFHRRAPTYADAQTASQVLGAGAQYGILLPFWRSQELEADRLGLTLMAEAGYNPQAAILFWQ